MTVDSEGQRPKTDLESVPNSSGKNRGASIIRRAVDGVQGWLRGDEKMIKKLVDDPAMAVHTALYTQDDRWSQGVEAMHRMLRAGKQIDFDTPIGKEHGADIRYTYTKYAFLNGLMRGSEPAGIFQGTLNERFVVVPERRSQLHKEFPDLIEEHEEMLRQMREMTPEQRFAMVSRAVALSREEDNYLTRETADFLKGTFNRDRFNTYADALKAYNDALKPRKEQMDYVYRVALMTGGFPEKVDPFSGRSLPAIEEG